MFQQPSLPYALDALAPTLSQETLSFHYGKHEKAYIDNLNTLIAGTEYEGKQLEDIILTSKNALFNNAAQAWNHIFYFESFSPNGGGKIPSGAFRDSLDKAFGHADDFMMKFETAGIQIFGSGWVWLSKDANRNLVITQGSNASTPLIDGLKPILCFDVWEHAYYLDYQNRRADHLHALWNIVDWTVVQGRFLE